jgi:hypothetical protein
MSFLDGFTVGIVRTGPAGGRFYAPMGKWGAVYEIPDDAAAARIRAEWRLLMIVLFAVLLLLLLVIGATWKLVLLTPAVFIVTFPFAYWVARGLPKAPLTAAELPPVRPTELLKEQSRAFGRRTLGVLVGLSVFMTALGILAAVVAGGGLGIWVSVGFFVLCTVVIYAQYRNAR